MALTTVSACKGRVSLDTRSPSDLYQDSFLLPDEAAQVLLRMFKRLVGEAKATATEYRPYNGSLKTFKNLSNQVENREGSRIPSWIDRES